MHEGVALCERQETRDSFDLDVECLEPHKRLCEAILMYSGLNVNVSGVEHLMTVLTH